VNPKDWDAKRQLAKAKPGTDLTDVNTVPGHYTDAATALSSRRPP
jgi:hypothetical protein